MFSWLKNKIDKSIDQAKMAEHTFMVLVAVFIGVLGGLGALGVRWLIKTFMELSFGDGTHIIDKAIAMPWYILIIIPAIGGAIIGPIIYFFAKEAKGHGVPEVMEAVVKRDGVIRPRVVLVKAIASSLCIGTGGSTGREGPIVQIGASIGSAVGQLFKLPANKLRTLVGCGAAAGIAATFNAPVAGALFAVEIILGDFGVAQFSPIVISSVIATVVSHQFLPDFPIFVVPKYELVSTWELIPYVILGFLAAAVGVLFIKVLYKTEDFFDALSIPDYIKPLIGGLLIGIIGIALPQIFGVGHEAVNAVLTSGTKPIKDVFPNLFSSGYFTGDIQLGFIIAILLILMSFVKIVATSLTLGSGGSGGIFAPSLFIGAMLGGGFGMLLNTLYPGSVSSSGAYALVAMGAVVSAVTQAPITAILVIFELTNDYKIILPLMIASIISTLVARRMKKESIYTLKLLRRGVDIEEGQEINILKSIRVVDVMEYKQAIIPSNMKLSEVLNHVVNSPHTCFVVVDDNKTIMGYFTLHDFKRILTDYDDIKDFVIAEDVAEPNMPFVKEDNNLDYTMKQFGLGNTDELPVLDDSEKKVIGVIWKNDVINSYNREILKADTANGMASRISTIDKFKEVEVVEGFSMIEISVPRKLIGETLISANVRVNYGVEVLLVRKIVKSPYGDKDTQIFIPPGDYIFHQNDKLLFFGENDKITKVQKL